MIEAEITCICNPGIIIHDLGLTLKKGDVVYIPEEQARRSKDLSRIRAGVTVRMIERCRERRSPPSVPRSQPPRPAQQAWKPTVESAPTPPLPDVEGAMAKLLAPLVEEIAALRRETQRRPVATSSMAPTHGTVTSDTPKFIPNDLAGAGFKAEIASESEEQSGDSLDAASAALRALKGKRHG